MTDDFQVGDLVRVTPTGVSPWWDNREVRIVQIPRRSMGMRTYLVETTDTTNTRAYFYREHLLPNVRFAYIIDEPIDPEEALWAGSAEQSPTS